MFDIVVALGDREACRADKMVLVPGPLGYLSSTVTEETACGSVSSPWRIDALPGQRINITLMDFSADITDSNIGGQGSFTTREMCIRYGVITEGGMTSDSGMRMAICRGTIRTRHLYQSRSNSVVIYFSQDRDGKTAGNFLLKYESTETCLLP